MLRIVKAIKMEDNFFKKKGKFKSVKFSKFWVVLPFIHKIVTNM